MDNYLSIIKKEIEEKTILLGTHINLRENIIPEIMGKIGFDFLWIDMEHTSLNKESVQNHLISCSAASIASFVRIPIKDSTLVRPVLEMNPSAIVFPFIMNAEDAKKAVESCKYPPKGKRGFGPKRANYYGLMELDDYIKNADSNIWVIIQIEHTDAVKNLDEILKVDGIDSIVVGPNDLSASIGLLGKLKHPRVKKLMDDIAYKTHNHNKPLGVSMGFDLENIEDWINRGVAWITIGTDISCLIDGAKKIMKVTKELISKYKQEFD